MKKILFFFATAMTLMACSSSKDAISLSSINGEWNISKVNGSAVSAAADMDAPFIGFNVAKKQVYGNTGCNHLTGQLNATNGGSIDMTQLGSTKMLCHDMKKEQQILGALETVSGYKMKGGNLILTDKNNKSVIELTKK